MDTLLDVRKGTVFLIAQRCIDRDATVGLTLDGYGPNRIKVSTGTISPAGVIAGQLADTPANTPVVFVTGFTPVSVGDVLENSNTGETAVCRWSGISATGQSQWSSSVNPTVVYSTDGWVVIGQAAFSA